MPPSGSRRTLQDVAASTATAAPLSRKRRILIWVLVVLATVLALVSILTTWVNRQMLDNDAWNRATTQVIEDPKVQTAIGNFTVNQLYENVDVTAALEKRLPPRFEGFAPTLSGALEQPLARGVALLLQRPKVQQAFISASTVAHHKLVNVLENKTGYGIETGSGVVTLDLHELVVELGTQLGLSSDTLAKLPAKAGTVTLMKSSQLSAAQTGVQAVRVLSVWLLVAVLVLYGLAIYLARGRRRATLRNAGFGFAIAGVLVLIIRNLLGSYLTDALASPGYEPATHRLYLIGTSVLGQIGQAALLYGLVAALGAILAGPTGAAIWLRRHLAPTLNEQPGIVWGGVGFLYLLAIWWGGTHALREWWGILLLGGLIAIGVAALRRETLKEFPSGAAGDAAPATSSAAASELARLAELHKSGAISDDEFERATRALT
jgi:hypothetical protein